MFERLAHLMYRRRWFIIGVWIVVLAVAGVFAAQVNSVLGPGNFVEKGTDSARASALLDQKFRQNDLKVTLVVLHSPTATVNSPRFRHTVSGVVQRIRGDAGLRVAYLDNPLVSGNRQLIARDGHSIAILLSSNLEEQKIEAQIDPLRALVRTPGWQTHVTGTPATNHDFAIGTKNDLARSESITVPILLLILLFVFGTVGAAVLPLVLAAFSIALSLALVYFFGHLIDTSVYVTNVVTALGLGVGIDYSLFIVFRFREELRATGNDIERAVVRTMATTGRAVFFSGLTVAIGLSSLILTNVSFMQSMGLGGMVVPVTALLVAMTLLPALLSVLGARVNRWRVVPARFLATGERGMWHNLAHGIMRRPLLFGGAALAVLLAVAFPVTQLNITLSSLKNAPRNLESVAGILYMQSHFPSSPNPTQVVIDHQGTGTLLRPAEIAGLRSLQAQFARDPEVARVTGPATLLPASGHATAAQLRAVTGRLLSTDERTAIVSIVLRHDPGTKQASDAVRRLRTLSASAGTGLLRHDAIYVGGEQAADNDFNDALYAHFPLVIAIVLLLTYGFLFYAFRSVFLPLKAVLLNLLSVGASYGMLELVFQRGIGSSLLGFTPESGVAGWVPIFLFAFLFGLSMDYEVFLISRIREGWLATRDNTQSVAFGLEKTGRLISSAALVMVVAFAGFIIGGQVQLKEFGFGLLAAIALDASLIRLILVPSIMKLMGNLNWWVPGFLQGFAARGNVLSEGESLAPEESELVNA